MLSIGTTLKDRSKVVCVMDVVSEAIILPNVVEQHIAIVAQTHFFIQTSGELNRHDSNSRESILVGFTEWHVLIRVERLNTGNVSGEATVTSYDGNCG